MPLMLAARPISADNRWLFPTEGPFFSSLSKEVKTVLLRRRREGWIKPADNPLHGQSLHDDGKHHHAVADW